MDEIRSTERDFAFEFSKSPQGRRYLPLSFSPLMIIDGIFSRKIFSYNKLPSQHLRLSVLKLDGSCFGNSFLYELIFLRSFFGSNFPCFNKFRHILSLCFLVTKKIKEIKCQFPLKRVCLQILKLKWQRLSQNLGRQSRQSSVTCLRRGQGKFHGAFSTQLSYVDEGCMMCPVNSTAIYFLIMFLPQFWLPRTERFRFYFLWEFG